MWEVVDPSGWLMCHTGRPLRPPLIAFTLWPECWRRLRRCVYVSILKMSATFPERTPPPPPPPPPPRTGGV